jgi:hypothetical protein
MFTASLESWPNPLKMHICKKMDFFENLLTAVMVNTKTGMFKKNCLLNLGSYSNFISARYSVKAVTKLEQLCRSIDTFIRLVTIPNCLIHDIYHIHILRQLGSETPKTAFLYRQRLEVFINRIFLFKQINVTCG